MTVRDEGTEAEEDFRGDGSDGGQHYERFDVGAVGMLELVRMEDQVIPYPDRVESVTFDPGSDPDQRSRSRIGTEVREKKSILVLHEIPFCVDSSNGAQSLLPLRRAYD